MMKGPEINKQLQTDRQTDRQRLCVRVYAKYKKNTNTKILFYIDEQLSEYHI